MKAIYVRVSTNEQLTDRQKINKEGKVYEDKISGTVPFAQRPQASKLINDIEQGKITEVEVSSLSRLGRKMSDLIYLIDYFDSKKINLIIKDLGLSSLTNGKKNKMFSLVSLMLSSFSEMQRDEMLESQAQAIAIKKLKGLKYHDKERQKETPETIIEKYKNVIKDINSGVTDAQILKTNYIIFDKNFYNLTEVEKKRYRGKAISRNTLKKIKGIIC